MARNPKLAVKRHVQENLQLVYKIDVSDPLPQSFIDLAEKIATKLDELDSVSMQTPPQRIRQT